MITIAVAGGTSGIGRAISEAVHRKEGYDVKILSRSLPYDEQPNPQIQVECGIEVIAIDYTDVASMRKVLEKNNVDTVISTLFVTDDGSPQVNLVRAAQASASTRRFIPSIWGIPYSRQEVGDRRMQIGQAKLDAVEALEKSSLEYTLFYVGYFLDFWGFPKVKSFQRQNVIAIDIEHNTAAIPGTGNTPVVFSHTLDVAEFVAASLDLGRWDRESYVIGDIKTWNEFLNIAEEVKGKKFSVTYDRLDLLLSGRITELPSHPSLYSQMPKEHLQSLFATFGVWFEEGLFYLQPSKTLNQMFPDIQARTLREVIEAGWGRESK